jgi:hypothetical protein
MNARILAALAALALVAGCGKNDKQGTDMESFAADYASIQCNALATCACSDRSAVPSCEAAYTELMKVNLSQTFARSPGFEFDEARGQACLADLRAAVAGCPGPNNEGRRMAMASPSMEFGLVIKSCSPSTLLVGSQAEGEYCSSNYDCAPGLLCDDSTSTCAARGGQDASCAIVGCQVGYFCDGGALCQALLPAGDPCADNGQCADGTSCVDVGGTLTCLAPHAQGEDCSTDNAGCVAGTYCATTCQAELQDGDECEVGFQCVHTWCDDGTCADPGYCSMVGGK